MMHGLGLSNKMCPQLQPKKDLGKAVLAVNIVGKGVINAVNYYKKQSALV